MDRLVDGDPGPIKALCSHRSDVTAFLGWGAYEKGWADVAARWDWAASQFKGGEPVVYESHTTVMAHGLAYAKAIQTIRVRLDGTDPPVAWSNRVTHVFRREDGEWRLVHRHANRLEGRYPPSSRLG